MSSWTTCLPTPPRTSKPGWIRIRTSTSTFTPVGSSWLNQIETWFGVITRQSIRRGTFSSVKVLIKQIREYMTHWNASAKPFIWTATADEILTKVRLVEAHIKKLVDNNAQ